VHKNLACKNVTFLANVFSRKITENIKDLSWISQILQRSFAKKLPKMFAAKKHSTFFLYPGRFENVKSKSDGKKSK
jgi:hypothetical protein